MGWAFRTFSFDGAATLEECVKTAAHVTEAQKETQFYLMSEVFEIAFGCGCRFG